MRETISSFNVISQRIIDDWNAGADEYNQWDTLDEEEKIVYAYVCGKEEEVALKSQLDQERIRRRKIQKAALRGIIEARDSVMADWSKDLDRLEEELAKERKLRKTFEAMLGSAGVNQHIIAQVIREVCDDKI